MIVRVDGAGDGHFKSGRIGHLHQGTDCLCTPGQAVYSPVSGTVVREAIVYSDDPQWKGVVVRSDDGYECKLFYCLPERSLIGQPVGRGQLVGYCQGISRKYGGGMKNHLHVEVRLNGTLLNPETVFTFTA